MGLYRDMAEEVLPDDYLENVMKPLRNGEGVACFLSSLGDATMVLYATHRVTGKAEELSEHKDRNVRAAQAIAIQREARQQSAARGFVPEVE